MITSKLVIVLSVTLLAVILFNIAIFFSVKRRTPSSSYQMFGKVAKRARNPWEEDNAKLEELSKQVADLQQGVNTREQETVE